MNTQTIFVGIDVSVKQNVMAIISLDGKRISESQSFANNREGAQDLVEVLTYKAIAVGAQRVLVATEATSFYDLHIASFILGSKELSQFDLKVYRLNPKQVKKFKDSLKETGKTDLIDAEVIAQRLRFAQPKKAFRGFQAHLPLQRLTRYRIHLLRTIVGEKNYFLAHLFLKFSSFADVKPFSAPLGATSQALVNEFFSLEELAEIPLEDLVSFVIKHGKNRFPHPRKTAELVKRMARESYRIRPSLDSTLNIILASVTASIRALKKSLKEISREIANEFKAFPNTLSSVNGLGPTLSAGIYAEIGDIKEFSSHGELANFAGLWWKRHQSGDFEADITRLAKGGNAYLRYYLVEAANSLRVHNEEYKRFYKKKFRQVRTHQHKRALVLTARKLVRLVFYLLKNNQLYDPNRNIK
jgi:transposase